MLSLHWRKISLLLLLVLGFYGFTKAQSLRAYNFNNWKNKPYYFGINLGLGATSYQLDFSEDFILNDNFYKAVPETGVGGKVGVIGNLKFGQNFDFRLIPGFVFSETSILYERFGGDTEEDRIEATLFELPFLFRYKSKPYKDMRMFMLAGFKYTYFINSDSRTQESEEFINFADHDYSMEVGFGFQFFFPYFIFSPEIKLSQGLNNTLLHNGSLERSNILEGIRSRMISITFSFEG